MDQWLNKVTVGDCRELMAQMPEQSVHMVATSPPYWGLRVYDGCPESDWGDWTGCLGLEPTVGDYIDHLMLVMDGVWRVLRDDGVCFVNLGDTHAGGGKAGKGGVQKWGGIEAGNQQRIYAPPQSNCGVKSKSLCLVPQRFAIAAQARGWIIRNEIVWHKPNPMPSSATDRCTVAHETVWLMTKNPRYFWDQEAIRGPAGANARDVWTIATESFKEAHFAVWPTKLVHRMILAGSPTRCCEVCGEPWVRVVEKGEPNAEHQKACGGDANGEYHGIAQKDYDGNNVQNASALKARILAGMKNRRTTGFAPTCTCDTKGTGKAIVLDPFAGSCTTGLVALLNDRDCIMLEASPTYAVIGRKRMKPGRENKSLWV